ncbi:MAG TPA: hypothetical protein DCP31_32565 [Cyanobacteria bacterium UBA8543]|nr:hypothetical protein [Cyanobacteria bacterium UBA8543]
MGVDCLDEAFKGIIEPVSVGSELVRSNRAIAKQIAAILSNNWGNLKRKSNSAPAFHARKCCLNF